MLRPFFPELVMSMVFFNFEHPSVLLFCLLKRTFIREQIPCCLPDSTFHAARLSPFIWRQNRSIEECSKLKNPENKTSSGESGLNIRTYVGHDQVIGELASSVGMPHPLQMFYGNLEQLGKKSNSGIRSGSVKGSKLDVMSDQWSMWSSSRLSCNIRERGTFN